ncbi:MAG: hypothetical protein AVDCRST_MAG73-2132, partial [uncultured Thermomicrobiales bacterium]
GQGRSDDCRPARRRYRAEVAARVGDPGARRPAGHPDRDVRDLPLAVLLDVDDRAQNESGTGELPGHPLSPRLPVVQLQGRDRSLPVLALPVQHDDHHRADRGRLGDLQPDHRLRVLAHRVAGSGQDFLPDAGDGLRPLPGADRGLVRHLRPPAASGPRRLVAGLGEGVDQHVPAPGGAVLLRQRVLDLPDAAVLHADLAGGHRRGPDRRRQRPPDPVPDHPAPGGAGGAGGFPLRRPPRLERFSRAAALPAAGVQVHPGRRPDLLPVRLPVRHPVQPADGGGGAGDRAGGGAVPAVPALLRRRGDAGEHQV